MEHADVLSDTPIAALPAARWTRRIDRDMLGAPIGDEMSTEQLHTDGNSIAGLLQEVFVADMTAAPRVCQSCGETHPIGSHRLYKGAGYVLRCPACGDVAACIAALPEHYAISLRGMWTVSRTEP